jgi:hypothetical protein
MWACASQLRIRMFSRLTAPALPGRLRRPRRTAGLESNVVRNRGAQGSCTTSTANLGASPSCTRLILESQDLEARKSDCCFIQAANVRRKVVSDKRKGIWS